MSYSRHYTIDHYLQKVRVHSEPYLAEIAGKEIIILPQVMSPKYDRSAQMFISMMPNQNGKRVLEIGSGTGILSLFSLLQGAVEVVAVDINPIAVENSEENFNKYGFTNYQVFVSDLFTNIDSAYDTIIFNAPFHGNKAEDMLELGTSDEDYRTLTRFMCSVGRYLKNGGEVLLGFADTGDNTLLHNLIKQNRLKVNQFLTFPNGNWTMYLYIITKIL